MSKINKKSLYSWGLSLALFRPLTLGNWITAKMSLEVFPSDFIIWVPTQPPHADTCWPLFILAWWQIVFWMASQSTCLSFRDWRHLSSPVEMQVHIKGTRLSPFLLACLCPNSASTFFLYQYFGQPGQSNLSHPGLAYHHDHVSDHWTGPMFFCAQYHFGASPFTPILLDPCVLMAQASLLTLEVGASARPGWS